MTSLAHTMTPLRWKWFLRGQSTTALTDIPFTDLPKAHRRALSEELEYRKRKPWMDDGAGME